MKYQFSLLFILRLFPRLVKGHQNTFPRIGSMVLKELKWHPACFNCSYISVTVTNERNNKNPPKYVYKVCIVV